MTLITNRYHYHRLKRVEVNGQRKYEWGGDVPVPSVTTILGATKDQTHLIEWRKRVGQAQAAQITTEAASRGTRMHKYLETYIETGEWPTPGTNPYAQHAHKMATVIKVHALADVDQIWGSEVSLYFPKIYAGTADVVGTYRGNPAILDFKQTNKPKKAEWIEDYFLQICLYAEAHNQVHGTDIKQAHIFMCSQNLEYQQFDIWPDQYDQWRKQAWARVEQYYLDGDKY
jgi:hypothetical protein